MEQMSRQFSMFRDMIFVKFSLQSHFPVSRIPQSTTVKMIAACTHRSFLGISPAALRFWSSKGRQKWQPALLLARIGWIPCWKNDFGNVRHCPISPIAHVPGASSVRGEKEPNRSRSMSGSLARWKGNGNHAESKEKAKRKIRGIGDKKKRKVSTSVKHGSSKTMNYPVGFGDIFLGPWTEQLRQAVQLASVKMDTLTSLKHINTSVSIPFIYT